MPINRLVVIQRMETHTPQRTLGDPNDSALAFRGFVVGLVIELAICLLLSGVGWIGWSLLHR